MEHSTWTDGRLDDRFNAVDDRFDQVDARFDRVDAEIRDLRGEFRLQGAEIRSEMREQGVELRGEMAALRTTLIRVGGGMMAGLVGVIAAVLVSGA